MPETLASAWFRGVPEAARAEMTLVCLPHAGGGASTFRDWKTQLPAWVETLAVQYPGHEGRWRDPLCRELDEIVEPLAHALSVQVKTSFALYGHSLGAFLAFEVARVMRREGWRQPVHLFVSGSRAPDTVGARPPVHTKSDAEFLEHVRDLGGFPSEVLAHAQLMDVLLPILRTDLRMDETYVYRPEPPLACPITAFAGLQDEEMTEGQAEAWRRHTRGAFRLVSLPAGHFWPPACEAEILGMIAGTLRAVL